MISNTTTRGNRSVGTVSASLNARIAQYQAHRTGANISGVRDRLVLQGKYVLNSDGLAEVVVSVNQKAFKQKMAVRDINSRVVGRTTNEEATAVSIGSF